jgi:hypothetical protein
MKASGDRKAHAHIVRTCVPASSIWPSILALSGIRQRVGSLEAVSAACLTTSAARRALEGRIPWSAARSDKMFRASQTGMGDRSCRIGHSPARFLPPIIHAQGLR